MVVAVRASLLEQALSTEQCSYVRAKNGYVRAKAGIVSSWPPRLAVPPAERTPRRAGFADLATGVEVLGFLGPCSPAPDVADGLLADSIFPSDGQGRGPVLTAAILTFGRYRALEDIDSLHFCYEGSWF